MKTSRFKLSCALLIGGLALAAATAETEQANANATILFAGSSTLHNFEGTVRTPPFFASFHTDKATGKIKVSAKTMLHVAAMTTENKKRDKNMFKMFEQTRFGTISGSLTDAEIPTSGTGTATLRLKIRAIEQDIEVTFTNWKQEGDLATINMEFPVSLKAFNLKGPSVMGLIRVGDMVNIECTILVHLPATDTGK